MCFLLVTLLLWIFMVAFTYGVFYYESANGVHLQVLRSRGSVALLLLKGFLWSLLSHFLLLLAALTAVRRSFWCLPPGRANRPPVIFVHGLYHNHTAWYFYLRWFRKWGWQHLKAVNLQGKFRSIEDYAEMLTCEVEQVLESSLSDRVDLVGHSMGGLVIRFYLTKGPAPARVRRAVTLACPHRGSRLAVFGPGAAAREMLPESRFLRSLNSAEAPLPEAVRFYNIYSILDNMILPNESGKISGDGVVSLESQPLNHVGLLFSRRTAELVGRCLSEP